MKLTWDNIDDIKITKKGNFKYKDRYWQLREECPTCKEPFLYEKQGLFCSHKCRKMTDDHIDKLYNYKKKGSNNPNWKGGGITVPYSTFHERLEEHEKIRYIDGDILEVQCFKCHGWFKPTRNQTNNRILGISGKHRTYNHFYCSDHCKKECSVFRKRPDTIIKKIEIENGTRSRDSRNKEFQSTFRILLIEKYGEICIQCGDTSRIEAHHINPLFINEDIFTWDMDNGILLCKKCHLSTHKGTCNPMTSGKIIENEEK